MEIYLLVEGARQVIEQMWLPPPYQGEQVLLCQSVPGTVEMYKTRLQKKRQLSCLSYVNPYFCWTNSIVLGFK